MHSKSPLGSKQGHSGQDPGAPAPQSSVARISCSRVRFFIPVNLLPGIKCYFQYTTLCGHKKGGAYAEVTPSVCLLRSQPPSPQGKALGGTVYHKKVQHFKFVRCCESLPRGGRWPRSGRMRATFRKQSVVYQRSNALTIFIPVTPSTPSNTALQTKHTPAPPTSWRRQATHRIVKSHAGKKR